MVKKCNRHMLLIFILEFSNYTKITMGTLYTKLDYRLDELRTPTYKKNNGQNTGEFYYTLYVTSIVLLAFILWNTLEMVTRVTETCRC
jgi:hypothetical protein